MGTKVNPRVFRLATVKGADAKWFARGLKFKQFLKDDVQVREFLVKKLKEASLDRVDIERTNQNLNLIIHSGKPGVIIGRAGAGVEDLKKKIKNTFYRGRRVNVSITVTEVTRPSLSSAIVAQQVAF
ncbi:MAG: KH domain-containing protein, partial [Patescibacteria group bacterium]